MLTETRNKKGDGRFPPAMNCWVSAPEIINELQIDSSLEDLLKKANNLAMAMLKIDNVFSGDLK